MNVESIKKYRSSRALTFIMGAAIFWIAFWVLWPVVKLGLYDDLVVYMNPWNAIGLITLAITTPFWWTRNIRGYTLWRRWDEQRNEYVDAGIARRDYWLSTVNAGERYARIALGGWRNRGGMLTVYGVLPPDTRITENVPEYKLTITPVTDDCGYVRVSFFKKHRGYLERDSFVVGVKTLLDAWGDRSPVGAGATLDELVLLRTRCRELTKQHGSLAERHATAIASLRSSLEWLESRNRLPYTIEGDRLWKSLAGYYHQFLPIDDPGQMLFLESPRDRNLRLRAESLRQPASLDKPDLSGVGG
jgi:hypothetical protein